MVSLRNPRNAALNAETADPSRVIASWGVPAAMARATPGAPGGAARRNAVDDAPREPAELGPMRSKVHPPGASTSLARRGLFMFRWRELIGSVSAA